MSAISAQVRQAKDAATVAKAALDAASARLDQPRGVLTQIAAVGTIVQPGQTLYTLDGGHPIVLMTGAVPAWRDLASGVADGIDVKELETNLGALGYAGDGFTVDDHWDAATTAAAKAWQKALRVAQTGVVALGEVVFEPTVLRITADSATLGATVQQGTPILGATSTAPVVTVALDPALQTTVTAGDAVSVTMPDGSTTGGTVSDVGTVATVAQGDRSQGSNPTPTIEVMVAFDDPSSTRRLDQAPVSVNITTATADNVLAVPVSALVELLEGGYAVQVQADDGTLHYVRVELGLFATGWVAVTGQGLAEGQAVVVAQ
jgi:peptidoglycan hydrolase-like protein with peptidoglycan-binding domain